jgi:hypothetical protein
MEAFKLIYGYDDEELDGELEGEYEEWKKLKYSVSTSVTRLLNSKKITEEDAALFRTIISRANKEELLEIRAKISSIRAGLTKVSDLRQHVSKYDDEVWHSVPVAGKRTVSNLDKETKLEILKTVRLIQDHRKKDIIDGVEANKRIEHVRSLTCVKDVFEYRESIKLSRARAKC